jgi:restriction endonuclease S subunit
MEKMQTEVIKKNTERIQFLSFRDIVLWDVKRYLGNSLRAEEGYITLKSILTLFKKKVSHEEVVENKYQIISKINFSGNLFLREIEEIKTYKGDLYLVPQNAIIFSKINARHGCIYFHQDETSFVVSNEYPVFLVDSKKVNGEYLKQYLRSTRLKEHLNSKTTGISKARIKPGEFLSVPFPLKSLEIQRKLVDAYSQKIKNAQNQDREALAKKEETNTFLLNILGVTIERTIKKKGINFTKYSFIDRWAADYLFNLRSLKGIFESKYPVQKVRNFLLYCQYGVSSKATEEPIGIPILRMNNINNSELKIDDLKYISLSIEQKKKLLLDKGDLLFNRTNSKELVGKTAVFELDEEFTFASYLIRLKLDTEKVNVHFINYLFNSTIGRTQIDMISRQVLGQANINAQELQDLIFPIPELETQNKIVQEISKMKEAANSLKEKAELNRKEAIAEFEQVIFKN